MSFFVILVDYLINPLEILKNRVAIWTLFLIKVLETFQVVGHTFETLVSTLRVRETSETLLYFAPGLIRNGCLSAENELIKVANLHSILSTHQI